LDDFTKVLSLTSNTFDGAHLMSAKIHARDGRWADARKALDAHRMGGGTGKADEGVRELRAEVEDGEKAEVKAGRERGAQLWTACYESATRSLRVAPYAVEIREMRADCALRAGDIESAVGDLSRLTHLRARTAPLEHLTLFRLAYFFLPPASSPTNNPALTALKQCLHLDPDSKVCLPAHRELKAMEKAFGKVDKMVGRGEWRGVLDFLLGKDRSGSGKGAFMKTFEDALTKHMTPPTPSPSRTTTTTHSNPKPLQPTLPPTLSPRLTILLRHICNAHNSLNLPKRGLPFCERLLKQDPSLLGTGPGEEMDIGDIGRGEWFLAEEVWEEAVRVLEGAWERGRGEDVSFFLACLIGR
jgi:DnaJ family protein C protein 3